MGSPETLLTAIRADLEAAQRVLVVSHIRPDGDAIGSLLGLGLALRDSGKEVQMVLSDGVPASFRHLQGSDQVLPRPEGFFDYIVVVDSSDLQRTGEALNGYGAPDLNIDHHPTNVNFARRNLVQPAAVATAEILARHLKDFGLAITPPVANALLAGIVADTIGFRTSNMRAEALRIAADLMDAGGDLAGVYYPALVQRSFQAARYWGAGLSRLQREGRMIWTTLTLADRQAAGYPGRDDADLVNVLSAIEDVDVAIIFVEQSQNRVKISWRLCGQSATGLDVSRLAQRFGGGGHKAASGAEMTGALEEVQKEVLSSTRTMLADYYRLQA